MTFFGRFPLKTLKNQKKTKDMHFFLDKRLEVVTLRSIGN
jgi:hypothetical protein